MVNFNTFRDDIKQIQKQRKSNDVFIKQTLLGFLKDTCILLRDAVDSVADPDAHFQIDRVMVEYGHIYNVIYYYNEPGYSYPKQIKVFSVVYYPGGDVNLEMNLWSTNEYEGTVGMEMRENLLNFLLQYNLMGDIVKRLQHLIPMLKDLQNKQKQSESNMWKAYRSKTDEMFMEVNKTLVNGITIALTEPYDFTYGNRTFFGDILTFIKKDGKRNGELILHNTITHQSVSWDKLPLNSLARISRDIVHHERNLGE
jgi:hypothetical protein